MEFFGVEVGEFCSVGHEVLWCVCARAFACVPSVSGGSVCVCVCARVCVCECACVCS